MGILAVETAETITFMNKIFSDSGGGFVLIRMGAILLLTFLLAKVYGRLLGNRGPTKKIYHKFIHNSIVMLIYVIGIMWALDQIPNFNKGFTTLLAGSGIAALTIGLAAQESLGNAINGMFISMFKPFEVGDRIRLIGGDITGIIEDITLRHTVVRTFMNSRVIIPNSVINKDMIENSNFLDGRASGFIDVTITYDSDLELAQSIMLKVVTGHPDFWDNRTPEQMDQPIGKVYVRGLTLYGVDLRISMWTAEIGNNFNACSDARLAIKQEFDRVGVKIAHSKSFDPAMTPPTV